MSLHEMTLYSSVFPSCSRGTNQAIVLAQHATANELLSCKNVQNQSLPTSLFMRPRILVVDDDAAIRASLGKVLEEAGYAAVMACDGAEAVGCIAREQFALLILDLDLPMISGWEILELVNTEHPFLPVLVLTGCYDQCEPGATATADVVLEKPPDVVRLLKTIDHLLHQSPETRLQHSCSAMSAAAQAGYLTLPRWPDTSILGSVAKP